MGVLFFPLRSCFRCATQASRPENADLFFDDEAAHSRSTYAYDALIIELSLVVNIFFFAGGLAGRLHANNIPSLFLRGIPTGGLILRQRWQILIPRGKTAVVSKPIAAASRKSAVGAFRAVWGFWLGMSIVYLAGYLNRCANVGRIGLGLRDPILCQAPLVGTSTINFFPQPSISRPACEV